MLWAHTDRKDTMTATPTIVSSLTSPLDRALQGSSGQDNGAISQPNSGPDYLDNLAAIEATEPTDDVCRRAAHLIDRAPFTSTALAAMAAYMTELGDSDAAQILLDSAALMAEHEARTI
jgi:hypothetical protein